MNQLLTATSRSLRNATIGLNNRVWAWFPDNAPHINAEGNLLTIYNSANDPHLQNNEQARGSKGIYGLFEITRGPIVGQEIERLWPDSQYVNPVILKPLSRKFLLNAGLRNHFGRQWHKHLWAMSFDSGNPRIDYAPLSIVGPSMAQGIINFMMS